MLIIYASPCGHNFPLFISKSTKFSAPSSSCDTQKILIHSLGGFGTGGVDCTVAVVIGNKDDPFVSLRVPVDATSRFLRGYCRPWSLSSPYGCRNSPGNDGGEANHSHPELVARASL